MSSEIIPSKLYIPQYRTVKAQTDADSTQLFFFLGSHKILLEAKIKPVLIDF